MEEPTFITGRHRGMTPQEVPTAYLDWASKQTRTMPGALLDAVKQDLERRENADPRLTFGRHRGARGAPLQQQQPGDGRLDELAADVDRLEDKVAGEHHGRTAMMDTSVANAVTSTISHTAAGWGHPRMSGSSLIVYPSLPSRTSYPPDSV